MSRASLRASLLLSVLAGAVACGGPEETETVLFEEDDGSGTVGGENLPPAELPAGLGGTFWRFTEATCISGEPALTSHGFGSIMEVQEVEGGLRLVSDETLSEDGCARTTVKLATLPDNEGPYLDIEEIARIATPPSDECHMRPEDPRPGELLLDEQGRLELRVQRSLEWCGGYEVRLTYELDVASAELSPEQIIRRYAAYWVLGDAPAVAQLFDTQGTLVEPFTITASGDSFRHDTRPAVQEWFAETFATSPWRAMRVLTLEQTEGEESPWVMTFEYMDARTAAPFMGRTAFTLAAGLIFEADISLTSEVQGLVEPPCDPTVEGAECPEPEEGEGTATEGAEASGPAEGTEAGG
jgi:hypothetical protein